jgi:hypothetical protein
MSKTTRETRGSPKRQMLTAGITAAVVFGALGGMMPSLLRLAASLSGDVNAPLPGLAIALGIAAYGIVGATLAIVLGKTSTYDAFVTGIAAPALLASMIHGATDTTQNQKTTIHGLQAAPAQVSIGIPAWNIITSAQAQLAPPASTGEPGPSVTIYPKVTGSMPTEVEIRIEAQMNAGNKVAVETLRNVSGPQTIKLPPNTKGVWIGGQYVNLKGANTAVDLNATTRPSFGSGVLFALGGPRPQRVEISTIEVKPR